MSVSETDTPTFTAHLKQPAHGDAPPASLKPGSTVGRYILGKVLGSGGMGTVYEARDPQLDRKIAIKLLSTDGHDLTRAEQARLRDRMLREAHALAQLSHPNVVTVHDVGTFADEVFIAMELVEGEELKSWLKRTSPSVPEIIEAYLGAARGLHAAHRAGLVHRDFKPHNVVRGRDGRVRVIDFGLARAHEGTSPDPQTASVASRTSNELDISDSGESLSGVSSGPSHLHMALTRVGAIMGTPRYMSPEQHAGAEASPASDQFSFCVALFEALTGQPPFAGKDQRTIWRAMRHGEMAPIPSHVPRWVRRLLRRGLSLDPAMRFADMGEIIQELTIDRRARRVWAGVAAAMCLMATATVVLSQRDTPLEQCVAGAQEASVWSDERHAVLASAFTATGSARATEVVESLAREVGAFDEAFPRSVELACEATFLHGRQSDALLKARLACLRERHEQTNTLLDAFAQSTERRHVNRATEATISATRLDACHDAASVQAYAAREGDDPDAYQAARRLVARAHTLSSAGQFDEAMKVATEATEKAKSMGSTSLRVSAMSALAGVAENRGDYAEADRLSVTAAEMAATAQDIDGAARAWVLIHFIRTYHQGHYEELERFESTVNVLATVASNRRVLAEFNNQRGLVRFARGELDAAIPFFKTATQIFTEANGEEDASVASSMSYEGLALANAGRLKEAETVLLRAREIIQRRLGPNHPRMSTVLSSLATVAYDSGDLEKAARYDRRVVDVQIAAFGETHPATAQAMANLGLTEFALGHIPEAQQLTERALAAFLAIYGPKHQFVAKAKGTLGLLQSLDDPAGAERPLRESLDLFEELGTAETRAATAPMVNLAYVMERTERHAEAIAFIDRAIAVLATTAGESHAAFVAAHQSRCDILFSRSPQKAADCSRRTLALSERVEGDARESRAQAQFVLAQTTSNSSEAVSLAKSILPSLEAIPSRSASDLRAKIETFVAAKAARK